MGDVGCPRTAGPVHCTDPFATFYPRAEQGVLHYYQRSVLPARHPELVTTLSFETMVRTIQKPPWRRRLQQVHARFLVSTQDTALHCSDPSTLGECCMLQHCLARQF